MPNRDLRHLLQPVNPKAIYPKKPAAPMIPLLERCKILKFSEHRFACGYCGKIYDNEEYAWICIAACSAGAFEIADIESIVTGEYSKHRCPACGKLYPNREDAANCLDRCHDSLAASFPGDTLRLAVVTVPGTRPEILKGKDLQQTTDILKKKKKKGKQPALQKTAQGSKPGKSGSTGKTGFTPDDIQILADTAGENSSQASAEDIENLANLVNEDVEQSKEESGPEVLYRKPGQKPFTRDGAKYVCSVCMTKYFTRSEVEVCFESHPLKG